MSDCEQLENLEDIESRLYSELYHNVEAYQQEETPQQIGERQPDEEAPTEVVSDMRRAPPRPRYFQQWRPRPEVPLPYLQASIRPASPGNNVQLPAESVCEVSSTTETPVFSPVMAQLLNHGNYVQLPAKLVVEPMKATRRRRKRDNRRMRRSLMRNPIATLAVDDALVPPKQSTVTIFVSDSDDDVVEVKPEYAAAITSEDLTDVIYVPNPSPEVITVDEDGEPEKMDDSVSSGRASEGSKNSADKDDFITSLDALHHAPQFGEFDKPEFLKPTQLIAQTPCGSESTSSCTIDLTALQTGPFTTEHEFVQNNSLLFEDENLESFGNLITPGRRESTPLNDSDHGSGIATPLSSKLKKLPTLSHIEKRIAYDSDQEPLVAAKITKRKPSQDDSSTTSSKKSNRSKKKKHKTADEEEPEGDQEEVHEETIETTRKKSKKKQQAVDETEADEAPKKSKKKRRDTNDASDFGEANESRKKKHSVIEEQHEADEASSTRKSKNKKREANDLSDSLVVVDEANNETRSGKKRQSVIDEAEAEQQEADESTPRKSKSRKRDTNDYLDSPTVVVDEVANESRASKKRQSVVMIEDSEEAEVVSPKKMKSKKRADTNDALESFLIVDEANESVIGKKRQSANEEDAVEETPKKSRNKKKEISDALGSFVVVDEVNESTLISSSDSDNLSELQAGDLDIQLLNCSPHLLHHPVQNVESHVVNSSRSVDLIKESVDDVLRRMSNDPRQWAVLESDRLRLRTKGTARRCNRCREVGHPAVRCPNKVTPKCNLCGAEHYESRCPDKMCTGCGRSQGYSSSYCKFCFNDRHQQCEICWNDGHSSQVCPDLWRRYHLTTEEGPLVRYVGPKSKPRSQLWCSGCAKSGHLVHECKVFINSDYPKSDPFIRSYKDIYGNAVDEVEAANEYDAPQLNAQQYGIPSLMLPNEIQQNFFFNQNYCAGDNGGSPQGQYNVNFYNNTQNYQNGRNNAPLQLIQALIPQSNVTYHDQLPNYINLSSCTSQPPATLPPQLQQQQQPQQRQHQLHFSNFENEQSNMSPADRRLLRNAHTNTLLFFKKSPQQIQQFVHAELRKLDKYVDNLKGIVGDLRRNIGKQGRNYRNLNMVLFGVYHLNDGSLHLDKLKNFRSCHPRAPITIAKRKDLFKAYNYIFGADGHEDDNTYKDLLLNAI